MDSELITRSPEEWELDRVLGRIYNPRSIVVTIGGIEFGELNTITYRDHDELERDFGKGYGAGWFSGLWSATK